MTRDLRRVRRLQVWLLCAIVAVGGGVTMLLGTLKASDNELIRRSVSGTQDAHSLQIGFTTQIQLWKDILLRGHDGAQLVKYTSQFRDEEAAVREAAGRLRSELVGDAAAQRLLTGFLDSHADLSQRYTAALAVFEQSGGLDYQSADRLVKGRDRAPTDTIAALVAHLGSERERSRQRFDAFVVRAEWMGALLMLLVAGAIGGHLVSILSTPSTQMAADDRRPRPVATTRVWPVLHHAQR
jgi:hypothetical protein